MPLRHRVLISLILGVLVGAVPGLTGAGGGILAVPVLAVGMGWPMLAVVMLFVAFRLLRQALGAAPPEATSTLVLVRLNSATGRLVWNWTTALLLAGIGALTGFVTGLLGVGGVFSALFHGATLPGKLTLLFTSATGAGKAAANL